MIKKNHAADVRGTLSRLRKNQEGNIIAVLAAAVVPVIGLVGGGVDMSRMYLVQSRLQGACDAGSLIGRKTMGVGSWASNGGAANTQALRMFDQNFANGAYGSQNLTRSFSEAGGSVNGTASATVPMALMQVLGISSKTITVACQAELRIPNTDVMFVLDTTGSMEFAASGSTEKKISGLKKAVKCFYEALAKQNITDVSPSDCGETVDPSNNNLGSVQLRFGFMPYAVNVNVGRLIPLDYMADQWTYQSREAAVAADSVATATYGAESAPTVYNTTNSTPSDTGWNDTDENMVVNGRVIQWNPYASKKSDCEGITKPASAKFTENGPTEYVSQSPQTPVEPNSTVTKLYEQQSTEMTRLFRYSYINKQCILEYKDTERKVKTVFSRTTTPITWDKETSFSGWNYKPVTYNVSPLKDAASNSYRLNLQLPLGAEGASKSIAWEGCIEERQTYLGTDSDPSDDWNPIPSDALDMNIDMVPTSDSKTKWGPMLTGAVWKRMFLTTNWYGTRIASNTPSMNSVFVSKNFTAVDMPDVSSYCPAAARKFQTWTPTNFKDYVNGLTTGGNTYHDIGLLWGARIMSPTGMFAALNAPKDMTIERHMVFMTDGETQVFSDDYSAYGVHWWDRRQTPKSTAPTSDQLEALTDARTAALCTAIKNKNINLWVVSYGNVGSATNDRLRACATPGKFFQAASVSSLVSNFKSIAAEISALRLTQ